MSQGFFGPTKHERKPEQLVFHPQGLEEFNAPEAYLGGISQQFGVRPCYRSYSCGACGNATTGRILCNVTRPADGATVSWCVCACEKCEPTIIVSKDGTDTMQLPLPKEFHADPKWPTNLAALYEEAAKTYSAGAFTACSMLCRKLLMSCVCHEQDKAGGTVEEGKSFAYYVDYLASTILSFPSAKASLDVIRTIGNEATHHITFVAQPDAERSMNIVHHMLNMIYTFPAT